VIRGLVDHWPAVHYAKQSPESLCQYLMSFDRGSLTHAVMVPAQFDGKMFYADQLQGFNYFRNEKTITGVIEQLVRYSHFADAPSVAVQCAKIEDCLPGFNGQNNLSLLDASVSPRIWLGNRFVTAAHFDEPNNLACVVSGKRRFTLFPPIKFIIIHWPLRTYPCRCSD